MEKPPITIEVHKKRGRPKDLPWGETFDDIFLKRLTTATGEKTFEAECEYLANYFNEQQKIAAVGETKKSITKKYVRELAATRGYNAKTYDQMRWKYIDRLLKAARSFLTSYEAEFPEPLPEMDKDP